MSDSLMSAFSMDSVVRGYHIYKEIWTPYCGENLSCVAEPSNIHDPYAVAMKRSSDNATVGHIPRRMSSVCFFFLKKGTITCEITGSRQHSHDLPQGGLELPCSLTFHGDQETISKVQQLLKDAPVEEVPMAVATKDSVTTHEPLKKKPKVKDESDTDTNVAESVATGNVDDSAEQQWIIVPQVANNRSFVLTVAEKVILLGQEYLNDRHIAALQQLLLRQFPNTKGLQNSLLLDKLATKNVKIGHGIQILHDRTNHWIVACNLRRKDNIIEIYDSLYTTSTTKTRSLIGNLFQPLPGKNPLIKITKTQKQVGGRDCGVFAIAMVTAVLHGYDPELVRFSQRSMRNHLMKCLEAQSLTPFPQEILIH